MNDGLRVLIYLVCITVGIISMVNGHWDYAVIAGTGVLLNWIWSWK